MPASRTEYTPLTWVNEETELSAENLNHIESGVALNNALAIENALFIDEIYSAFIESFNVTYDSATGSFSISFGNNSTERFHVTKSVNIGSSDSVKIAATLNTVYGKDANGNEANIYYSSDYNNKSWQLVIRDANSDVLVPDTPTSDNGATSKKYVAANFVSLAGDQTITGLITFSNGINVGIINNSTAINFQRSGTTKMVMSASNLRPEINNSFDLGATSYAWKDLYLNGKISLKAPNNNYIAEIFNDDNGALYFTNRSSQFMRATTDAIYAKHLAPWSNSQYDLGTSSYTWKDIYFSGKLKTGTVAYIEENPTNYLVIFGRAGVILNNNTGSSLLVAYGINPLTVDNEDLGSATRKWKNLYLSGNLSDGTNSISVADIQHKLTAGTGISISGNTISCTLEGVDYQVYQELPQSGVKGVIYLVPSGEADTNIYNEYIWVTNRFEPIGSTRTDLSNYMTLDTDQTVTGSKEFVGIPIFRTFVGGDIKPRYNNASDIGDSTHKWKDIYLGGTLKTTNFNLLEDTGFFDIKYGTTNIAIFGQNFSMIRQLLPAVNNLYDLGRSDFLWKNLYLAGNLSDGTNSVTVAELKSAVDLKVPTLPTTDGKYKLVCNVVNGVPTMSWEAEHPTVTYTEDTQIISFTINGTSYQAESGMTWAEWVDSEYNTLGLVENDSRIESPALYPVELNTTQVASTDAIIANASYEVLMSSGGSNE